jgi:hypothetical protein
MMRCDETSKLIKIYENNIFFLFKPTGRNKYYDYDYVVNKIFILSLNE